MRIKRGLMVDQTAIDRAREAANLGTASDAAVVRYAVAVLAGLPVADALDSTPGRGSVTHRARLAATEGDRAMSVITAAAAIDGSNRAGSVITAAAAIDGSNRAGSVITAAAKAKRAA